MNVLVLSAHPDDETLGCGGTLLKHAARGHRIHWLVATAPVGARWKKGEAKKRQRIVSRVASKYAVRRVYPLGFPSTELAETPKNLLIDAVRNVVDKARPEVIYTVHPGDIHSDHRTLSEVLFIVTKPFKKQGIRKILTYECLSSTEAAPPSPGRLFVPNVYSDITKFMERKLKIMKLYGPELQKEPLPRSPSALRALGRVRGATVGVRYAEAFSLIRLVED